MRWVPWLLGIAGVVQHAIIAYLQPDGYVSTDMSYLVMWLAVVGALIVCYLSCDGYCGPYDDDGPMGACDCCDGHCHCGDCDACDPASHGHGDGNGHGHPH